MSAPEPTDYEVIEEAVRMLAEEPDVGLPEPTIRAYMMARAALLYITKTRGAQHAAELAYGLSDEIATGPRS